MYFRNYGLRKRGLDECMKNLISEHPSASNMVNWSIWTTAPLPYLLTTVNIIQLEKVSFRSM